MRYTPDNITSLAPNEVFVFGSNQFARHGAGAAYVAQRQFGAIYDKVPMGLCGNSYGIITTSFNDRPITTDFIRNQVQVLYDFAVVRPDLTFYVTKIGTGLAGFPMGKIIDLFHSLESARPTNIILPKEFTI